MSATEQLPDWAKPIVESIRMAREQAIREQVSDRLKNVPALFYKNSKLPDAISDVDAFCAEILTDYTAFQSTFQQEPSGIEKDIKGWANGTLLSQDSVKDPKIAAEIEAWAKNNL